MRALERTVDKTMLASVAAKVTNYYLKSHDFNGYPVHQLKREYRLSDSEAKQFLYHLILLGMVDVMFTGNPHIKPFASPEIDTQLLQLEKIEFSDHFCMYPKPETLRSRKAIKKYEGQPYKKELALGNGQLEFRTFDLSVLEPYRNDPRYYYECDSIHGSISVRDEFYESARMADSDQVLLQSFGFAYDGEFNRSVAVFLRYLADLSPEHQQLWRAKQIEGDFKLHPDYFRNCILGEWGTRISLFDAFTEELAVINQMCVLMETEPLFKDTFSERRPREFAFLLRPTLSEFNRFVLLLDKMMSDNLNKRFFPAWIPQEEEEGRPDGKIAVRPRGTITLLDLWFKKYFRTNDRTPIEELLATFRKVRKLRQRPAHVINDDAFDQVHFKNQRNLILDAYNAVRTIRLALANHPKVKKSPPEVGEELREGKIWDI